MGDSSFLIGGSETPWSDPSITITIGGNSPPTLTSIVNQTVNVGTLVALTANGTDPDGNALTYRLTTAPSGAMINPTTGGFTWTPTPNQGAMTHQVTVQVTDNGTPNLSASSSFTITVNPQVIVENRTGGAVPTGCATPLDGSVIRLQVQSVDKLLPLRPDTSDGHVPHFSSGEYSDIPVGSDSSTFNTTSTTYTVVIEMGSWTTGGSGDFVQRRYTHDIATDGCTQGRYRYLDFTVTGQGPGPLTLRVQPNGNQYEVVKSGNGTLSTVGANQRVMTDFTRTAGPYTP